jgi:hypothetical protein
MFRLCYEHDFKTELIRNTAEDFSDTLIKLEIFDEIIRRFGKNAEYSTIYATYYTNDPSNKIQLNIQQPDAKIAYGMVQELLLSFSDVRVVYNHEYGHDTGERDIRYKHTVTINTKDNVKCLIDIYAIDGIYEPEENNGN